MVEIRLATREDTQDILAIYSPYILTAASTFETEIPSLEQFKKRIEDCLQKFPWIVCSVNGITAGYVYASSHRERAAYQWSCECSAYVHDYFKGKGIGKELYSVLFEILKVQGIRNVYAGITLPNDASVKLHEKCGFEYFATYDNIGYKLNSWQKVGWWRLQLNTYDLNPSPLIAFSKLNHQLVTRLFQQAAQNLQLKITG